MVSFEEFLQMAGVKTGSLKPKKLAGNRLKDNALRSEIYVGYGL